MKNPRRIIIAAMALALSCGTTVAADLVDMPTSDWTGAYFGATVGYGFGRAGLEVNRQNRPATAGRWDIDGLVGGVTVGHNWQSGHIVFGVEGDLSAATISGSDTVVGPTLLCGSGPNPTLCTADVTALATVRGRVGYDMDGIMPFLTGGFAAANITAQNEVNLVYANDWTYGWTVGGGVERRFNDRISGKIEYLHINVPSVNGGGIFSDFKATFSELHVVRAGLNIHF